MMKRTVFQRALRASLFAGVCVASVAVPLPPQVLAAVVGALLAYDGASPRTAIGTVACLIFIELVSSSPIGVLSLSALVTALGVRLLTRLAQWVPWALQTGWSPRAFMGTVLAGTGAGAVFLWCGVLLTSWVYGAGMLIRRLEIMFSHQPWWVLPVAVAVTTLALRRVDTPLRKPIRFGQ